MARNKEGTFQDSFINDVMSLYPEAIVLKNDANYLQGFPDLTILTSRGTVIAEVKKSANEKYQPNQEHYLAYMRAMGYPAFTVHPENREEILHAIQQSLSH